MPRPTLHLCYVLVVLAGPPHSLLQAFFYSRTRHGGTSGIGEQWLIRA
jgi:hypothetical protein